VKYFVRGDIDGFFGLFIDNMLQLMLIQTMCVNLCGLPSELVNGYILPGAAISILFGNIFYGFQAWGLMKKTGRNDITALPYGINTPSMIAYIFLVMAPVYRDTQNADLTWKVGLFACFFSGIMECGGAFVGDWLRKHTPRAGLLSALAGVAITFISMNFIFQLYASPAIALLPMLIILIAYASRIKLPIGLPAGLVAILIGTILAWTLKAMGMTDWQPAVATSDMAIHLPKTSITELATFLSNPLGWKYMSIIFPMGLFNIIGSLQNLESAEAAGDHFPTRSSMLVNGIGSVIASMFGSTFPTTIYIGHPGWKAIGARAGYSILNGIVITIVCITGGMTLLQQWVPVEAMLGILLWIGIIITAQAFVAVPKAHAMAVAFGLIPAFAAWSLDILIKPCLTLGGKTLTEVIEPLKGFGVYLEGVISLSQGFLVTSLLYATILSFIIDRKFNKAAAWMVVAAVLSATGVIHAYQLVDGNVSNIFAPMLDGDGHMRYMVATEFAWVYLTTAALLMLLHFTHRKMDKAISLEQSLDRDPGAV
jgi:AGZA family xanthine/uracil permease-like MFS transporter